jgi:hypothetical protein
MSALGVERRVRIPARTIQIVLGVIWLADGLLQLQPAMLGKGFANNVIMPSAQGQPGLVAGLITHTAHLMAAQPVLTDLVFAGVQLLIGVGLLVRETVKPALALSFVWALGVWSIGEGFGGLLTGSAMPLTGAPGAALLYVAIGLLVWPRRQVDVVSGPAAAEGPLGERGGKAIWAVLWCGMGILWLVPASTSGGMLSGAVTGAAAGEPGWLSSFLMPVAHALGTGGTPIAVGAGILSIAIGVGPLLVRRYTVFLVAGVALALDCWVFGQAFGQLFMGIATDPSTGPLVVLLALAILPEGIRVPRAVVTEPARLPGLFSPRPGTLVSSHSEG